MNRVKGGWALTKTSWRALRENKGLMRFPILAALAAAAITVLVTFPGAIALAVGADAEVQSVPLIVVGLVVMAAGIYLATVAAVYFAVALAAAADAIFHGNEEPMARGREVARSRLRAIFGWALISTLVGFLLNMLQNVRGVGPIVAALMGTTWGLVTFLAVPVVAFEGTGPIETVKRSGQLFRQRWGGQITGQVAIGAIVGFLGILPSMLVIGLGIWLAVDDSFAGALALGLLLAFLGAIALVIAAMLLTALRGVFGVALYRFAGDGEVVGPFTADELERAVQAKS